MRAIFSEIPLILRHNFFGVRWRYFVNFPDYCVIPLEMELRGSIDESVCELRVLRREGYIHDVEEV